MTCDDGDGKVFALHGGEISSGKPNETCVKILTELLEMATAGEVVGVMCISNYRDSTGAFSIAGQVGSYSMLGASLVGQQELIKLSTDLED